LERQSADCRRHAAERGWKVVDELIDDGVSAFSGANVATGKLATFVEDAKAGSWPDGIILLTERLDRLSRRGWDELYMWMKGTIAAGVTIATVDGDRMYKPGTPFGLADVMEILIKAELAHDESAKKASRLSKAWESKRGKVERGEELVLTKRAPAWLRVEGQPRRFIVIEERAAIVRRIYEDTVSGIGKASIARELNREGVRPFGRASGWHASYIQKILRSSAVLGEFQPGRKPRNAPREAVGDAIQSYYPAIINADLHASAASAMAGRSRKVAGRGRRLVNLFAGLARCGACGAKMTFRGKGAKLRASGEWVQEDYLICDSYQRGRGCDVGHHFNYNAWQDGILDAILHDAIGDRHFSSRDEVRPLEVELAERERQHRANVGKRDAAMEMHAETPRPEVKAMWLRMIGVVDADEAAIGDLRKRVIAARGTVSPEEHLRRIRAMRDKLEDPDGESRFTTRSTIMAAVHDLVTSMNFRADPIGVEIGTVREELLFVTMEEHGGRSGPVVTRMAAPPA
jgi:DNA invertase Pin-like site-specific DNA recombinase